MTGEVTSKSGTKIKLPAKRALHERNPERKQIIKCKGDFMVFGVVKQVIGSKSDQGI